MLAAALITVASAVEYLVRFSGSLTGAARHRAVSPVLVTGATGFVGGGIARRLLADGRDVRALSRRPDAAAAPAGARRRGRRGRRARARDSVERAARGCEVSYHAPGVNGFCMRDPGPMRAANVTGTENVVAACGRAGVRRIVYTSSAAAIGEAAGVTATEDTPHRGWFLSEYERSKYDAELAAVREAERHGVELVCVNPASVQGPGRTGGTARLILDYANGRLRTIVRSRFSLVDVDDCSEGHSWPRPAARPAAATCSRACCVTTDEAIATLARITGIERRALTLPRPVALGGGRRGGRGRPRARPPPAPVPRDGGDAAARPRLRRLAGRPAELGLRVPLLRRHGAADAGLVRRPGHGAARAARPRPDRPA